MEKSRYWYLYWYWYRYLLTCGIIEMWEKREMHCQPFEFMMRFVNNFCNILYISFKTSSIMRKPFSKIAELKTDKTTKHWEKSLKMVMRQIAKLGQG